MPHLFPEFLERAEEYQKAQDYWNALWNRLPRLDREAGGWRSGWFGPNPQNDGNPIFTAISEQERKAIRIIQFEPRPEDTGPEVDYWLDTFGGDLANPRAIRELVICCSLSTSSSDYVLKLMNAWLVGDEFEIQTSRDS
jgi:hypothetical protein